MLSNSNPVDLKNELFRKSIHIGGVLVPVIAVLLDVLVAASIVAALMIAYLISERMRLRGKCIPYVTKITELATRYNVESQHKMIMSPLYLAIGILASLLVFPEPISYAAIIVLALGDGFASLVGKKYGRHKIPKTCKTIEGSLTCIVCALAGAVFFVSPSLALIAAATGTLIEILPLPINDNISVPLGAGAITWFLLPYEGILF